MVVTEHLLQALLLGAEHVKMKKINLVPVNMVHSSGAITKYHGVAITIHILTALEAGQSKIKVLADSDPGEGPFLVSDDFLLAVSSMAKREGGRKNIFSYTGLH